MQAKVSLDQWRAWLAVVDHGGYAQAAQALHLSQSTVSYAVARIQELLGVAVLSVEGRKARLTPAGEALLPRARQLLADAAGLEQAATCVGSGWESELLLAVEVLCPSALLLDALARFQPQSRGARLQIREEVLSGTDEVLQSGQAHLGVSPRVPPGCGGETLLEVEFLPVSHPAHDLQRLGRPLAVRDLARATQIFIRDSGSSRQISDGLEYSPQRWTVSSRETALELVRHGFGFCWAPLPWIEADLAAARLRPLPLEPPDRRRLPLYLVHPTSVPPGPATRLLAECLRGAARAFAGSPA